MYYRQQFGAAAFAPSPLLSSLAKGAAPGGITPAPKTSTFGPLFPSRETPWQWYTTTKRGVPYEKRTDAAGHLEYRFQGQVFVDSHDDNSAATKLSSAVESWWQSHQAPPAVLPPPPSQPGGPAVLPPPIVGTLPNLLTTGGTTASDSSSGGAPYQLVDPSAPLVPADTPLGLHVDPKWLAIGAAVLVVGAVLVSSSRRGR